MTATDKSLYYAVCISNSASRERGSPWVWSKAYDTILDAAHEVRRRVDAGEVTLGFVVEFKGGEKRPILDSTKPKSALRIIRHYLDLLERIRETR